MLQYLGIATKSAEFKARFRCFELIFYWIDFRVWTLGSFMSSNITYDIVLGTATKHPQSKESVAYKLLLLTLSRLPESGQSEDSGF